MNQLIQLISIELKEYLREPGIIFWAILFPILLALGLGVAFSGGGSLNRNVAVVCASGDCAHDLWANLPADGVEWSKRLGDEKMGFVNYRFERTTWDNAVVMLKQGKISMILEVEGTDLRYHFDPAFGEAKMAYLQLSDVFNGTIQPTEEIAVLKQEGTRYVDYLVPGLLALGIMMNCMWGISYSNVDRRKKKLLRRMAATPMKKSNYIIAQLAARVLMGIVEAGLLITITVAIFNIKITGSWLALFLLFLAGNMAFTGLAMLVCSRTSNTQIANGLINLVVMPMMIMSGVYFSYHSFPEFLITIIRLLPLTILADSMRAVFNEAAGIAETLPQIGVLALFGMVLFSVGVRVYRWY